MRAAPFFLVIMILVGGVFAAYQTITSPVESSDTPLERPTLTPRPRPTSPPTLVPRFVAETATPLPAPAVAKVPPTLAPTTVPPTLAPTATPMRAALTPQPTVPAAATVAPRQPSSTPAPPLPSPSPGAALAPGPVQPLGPTATPATNLTLRVGNTDRQGVYLRRTPRLEDKVRPWMDGTPMVVVGPTVVADGQTWNHVRAPDGTEGYIPAQYLVN